MSIHDSYKRTEETLETECPSGCGYKMTGYVSVLDRFLQDGRSIRSMGCSKPHVADHFAIP